MWPTFLGWAALVFFGAFFPALSLLFQIAPAVFLFFRLMNGVGALPVPKRDFLQGAARGDRLGVLQELVAIAFVLPPRRDA